jgi:hypothetical protein
MNHIAIKSGLVAKIVVVDRRNSAKPEQFAHEVSLIQDSKNIIVFLANWQFPVPAIGRKFFFRKREFAVEECGRISRRNFFQFTGTLIRKNSVRG